uniref:Uncharacterized protein n=1 Tax=Chromera velia CCMP2878 TaxID=1169474 RepID=A0A0G4HFI6_9ALVE|eukprot:Cvel_27077.t1-p1 / transcript=Cvel_27077.t1 / gene=Cvel_27077 / organism=Chromera_velia_CCMP2878 / gene_product=hypothetical protein / transcript_product=hypothetical protein / location=Cvel_scaffold3316:8526-8768(+) / protein_length=81 / sequence_SO=supercontig / SO=protein_coding / is_pseudo=false
MKAQAWAAAGSVMTPSVVKPPGGNREANVLQTTLRSDLTGLNQIGGRKGGGKKKHKGPDVGGKGEEESEWGQKGQTGKEGW